MRNRLAPSRRPTALSRLPVFQRPLERLEDRTLFATVPAGFQYADFVTGLPECTSMTFTPDGRIFYTEKGGAVRVVKNGQKLATPLVRVAVDGYFERGLGCVTLDPDFANNGVFYLYYTRRDPNNPNTVPNNAKNRISRFRVDPNNPDVALPGSEVVVLDNIPADSGYHNGGAMVFGADGYMYVGTGEVGQPSIQNATQRAQDLSTLAGKILRINPRAGAQLIPGDNPFVGQTGRRAEIYSYGLRNPFTMAVKPGTNLVYANDVGSWQYEEVNEVKKGANYGFPNSEGYTTNPAYTSPVYAYTHASTGNTNGQAAITGGTFYTGNKFPAAYQGKYFFADYVNKFIRVFDPAVPRQATTFATATNSIIDLDVGADGNLYGLSHVVGAATARIVKISYVGSGQNRAPEAVAAANKTSGPLPLTVNFSGNGSADPDGDALTYSWNFGDGTTATGRDVTKTYNTKGTYTAVLTVSDGRGGSDTSEPIVLSPGNEAPVITFTSPANDAPYAGDQTITYAATAADAEDGAIAASKFDWTIVLHHQTHQHPFLDEIDGVGGGSFKVPVDVEVDPVQFYRIHLSVTDSAGVKTSSFVDIQPQTSTFTLASNVAGATLTLDGQPKAAGTSTLGVVGTRRRIEAPEFQTVDGTTYEFVGWSDGGGRFHDIFTPAGDTTYSATYKVATTTLATRRAAADSYVRDGTYGAQNFGNATELLVKRSANSGNTRETYLRFAISDFPNIAAATLRLFGKSSTSTQGVPLALYGASNVTWSETGLTWNNKPAAGATALGSKTVAGTTGVWHEFDVGTYVQQQKAAGATAVTFVLKSTATTDAQALFNSDENAANGPELLVRHAVPQPVQALIVTPEQLPVAEGGQASFTVKLAQQPEADVVVTVARSSGDADLSATPGTLTFTPANWNVAQSVSVAAAQDDDATNGSAVVSVSATGVETKSVTVTEQDDDAPAAPVVLRATDDAYVRDGTYAGQNFGTAAELQLKKAGANYNREAYLKFDLSGVAGVASGKLRVYGRIDSSTETPTVAVYPVSNASWAETGLTWNNRPPAGATPLSSVTLVPGMASARYYEFDVTSFLQAEKAAGRNAVTLVLRALTPTTPHLIFASDEAAANKPQLVVEASGPVEPPQALVVSRDGFTVAEGASDGFTVKLAKVPTSDVVVTVARSSGDADLSATPAELTFTAANWDEPQTITVSAAEDADVANGPAVFSVSATGLAEKTVTVTEVDNDTPAGPVAVRASDDTYVRDGTSAGQNFGTSAELQLKKNVTGSNREIWLKFDLSGATSIGSAKLRLFGVIHSSETPSVAVYSASNTSWTESGLTWNTRPATGTTAPLATTTVATNVPRWYEWDVTAFLQAEKAAGRNVVTLVLRSLTQTTPHVLFNSDEAAADRPELLISP